MMAALGFILRYWRLILMVALGAGLWLHGHKTGRDQCEARHAVIDARERAEQFAAAEAASRREATRLMAEAEREQKNKELEDAAYADSVVNAGCLSADRVRRLQSR